LVGLRADWTIILSRIIKKLDGKVWTGFNWLWIGSNGGRL
jgi:hypothetical protein